mgnify:CR=1 FL=1
MCIAYAERTHCPCTVEGWLIYCRLALVDKSCCLDAAALRGHGALGATRLSVRSWLGLDGGREQCRLRRNGVTGEALCDCGVSWGEARCSGRALVGFGLRPGVDVGAVRCMRGLGLGFRHSLHRIEGEDGGEGVVVGVR